jgi:hypothetical protein
MAESEHDFIKERLDDQLKRHGSRARENKKKFQMLQVIIIITGALVPIVNSIGPGGDWLRIISSVLGGIIVIITSLIQLHKYQEHF